MKKLFMLFAVVVLASCSGDDDKNNNDGPQKFMTSITLNDGPDADVISLQYDDNKNLKAILEEGDVEYSFIYNGNNELTGINESNGDPFVKIQYENGKLSGYTTGQGTFLITYNEETGKYVFMSAGIEAGLKGRDLGTVNDIGGATKLNIDYNESYKGPFHNVATNNPYLLSLFLDLYYFVSTRPISAIEQNGVTATAENTYDADGYVTKMVLKSGTETQQIVNFNYSEL